MGQSTNGMLAYGYDLGDPDGAWKIEEADEDGIWKPQWATLDEEGYCEDIIEDAGPLLLASVGFTETDYKVDGYFDRKRDAEARLGIEFDSYCSGEYPMWVLAAHVITVHRGRLQGDRLRCAGEGADGRRLGHQARARRPGSRHHAEAGEAGLAVGLVLGVAMTRCDTTDLLVDQCGCKRHRGGQTPDEEAARDRAPGVWFPARYAGTCTRCGLSFEDNQDIRADGSGGWECCDD